MCIKKMSYFLINQNKAHKEFPENIFSRIYKYVEPFYYAGKIR